MKKVLTYFFIIVISLFIFYMQFQYKRTYQPHNYYQVYLDSEILGTIESKDELEYFINEQGKLIKNQVIEYTEILEVINAVNLIYSDLVTSNRDIKALVNNLDYYKKIYLELNGLINEDGTFAQSNRNKIISLINSLDLEETSTITINKSSITNYTYVVTLIDNKILSIDEELLNYISENEASLNLLESEISNLEKYRSIAFTDKAYSNIVYMNKFIEENEVYLNAKEFYTPLGISVKKVATYNPEVISVKELYGLIIEDRPCSIEGYQFRVKRQSDTTLPINITIAALGETEYSIISSYISSDLIIYVTDPEVFNGAIDIMSEVFVGSEEYAAYKNGTQSEIDTTGTIITNIYLEQEVTYKPTKVSVKERIYSTPEDLSNFLLYGKEMNITTTRASSSDTISSLAYQNQISVEEFFLSNPEFTSINNIFYDGQEVVIAKLDTQLNIVVEKYTVDDKETGYETVEQYDETLLQGKTSVYQAGESGIERVRQNEISVNGTITRVESISRETIKTSKTKIVLVGTKIIPNVGSLDSWGWPTNSGYTLTSYFGYRLAIFGEGDFHSGLDIAGTGPGSPIYATNNGTVIKMEYVYSYGYYIQVNHNNGYYTLYGHMSGFAPNISVGSTVSRGQIIGYMGDSGWATGTHLHYEIRVCEKYACARDPLRYY